MQTKLSHRSDPDTLFSRACPPEIVSQIIQGLWDEPQSPRERARLSASVPLVCHTWLCLFASIAWRDIHLPLPLSAHQPIRLLTRPTYGRPKRSDDLWGDTTLSQRADESCRSLAFDFDQQPRATSKGSSTILRYSTTDPAVRAISSALATVASQKRLPNLRHVVIKYANRTYETLFDLLGSHPFPSQVTHLTIEFAFDDAAVMSRATSLYSEQTIHRRRHQAKPPVSLSSVRRLSLSGMPMNAVVDTLEYFPNIETLDVTRASRLGHLKCLAPGIRNFVVNFDGSPFDSRDLDAVGAGGGLAQWSSSA
ncbi:hypothetical protein C8Q80DRAFT_144533 [Daedaleopsis nitida]|nr:hypothetical protein C8Q80DRAFT_144533 [Daedaleopsis nitida]